jgi:hypothetical protein
MSDPFTCVHMGPHSHKSLCVSHTWDHSLTFFSHSHVTHTERLHVSIQECMSHVYTVYTHKRLHVSIHSPLYHTQTCTQTDTHLQGLRRGTDRQLNVVCHSTLRAGLRFTVFSLGFIYAVLSLGFIYATRLSEPWSLPAPTHTPTHTQTDTQYTNTYTYTYTYTHTHTHTHTHMTTYLRGTLSTGAAS